MFLKQTLTAAIPPCVFTHRARGSLLQEVSWCTTANPAAVQVQRQQQVPIPSAALRLSALQSQRLCGRGEGKWHLFRHSRGLQCSKHKSFAHFHEFHPMPLSNPKLSSPASEPQSQAFCQAALTFRTQNFSSKSQVPCPSTLASFPCLAPVHIPELANLSSYILNACPLARVSLGPHSSCAVSLLPPSHLHCTWHRVSSLAKPWPAPPSLFSPHSPAESVALNPITSHHSPVKQLHPSPPRLFSSSPSCLLNHNQGLSSFLLLQ